LLTLPKQQQKSHREMKKKQLKRFTELKGREKVVNEKKNLPAGKTHK
jgi:hypothetical protein